MLIKLDFSNYMDIEVGDKIIYDNHVGQVKYDMEYTDGLKIDGKSLKYVIEEYDEVYWIKEN